MVLEQEIKPFLKWFKKYTKRFYSLNQKEQENILLKQKHSLRVYEYACKIALKEKFSREDGFALSLAGLFHDLGRFEQYKVYKTFKDNISEDHGRLGVKILKKEGVLSGLDKNIKSKILVSVILHNKLSVPARVPAEVKKIVFALRDADKLDIFEVLLAYLSNGKKNEVVTLNLLDEPDKISAQVLTPLYRQELVNYNSMQYVNDFKLLLLSWVYDFNFPTTFSLFEERDYFNRLNTLLPPLPEVKEVTSRVKQFILERVER
ncbi:MAG TPA: HD family phosphohydrolase [Desulfonauticus sp.]|nr:MAG: Putative domain HDIG-containing protein [Desulfonauticus sp. 38_4375]HCO12502.1 HD family phosphohydrolase [Desulfonauticus sp.]